MARSVRSERGVIGLVLVCLLGASTAQAKGGGGGRGGGYTLAVSKNGSGSGGVTSSPKGISCGRTCSATYASGTSVVLTAKTATGSAFAGWPGGGCSGTSTCTVVLQANTTVTATFVVPPAAPTGVTATAGDDSVTISWSAVAWATSYNVYSATASGVTKSNYSTMPNGQKHAGVASPFVAGGLTAGTSYYFVVTAVDAAGESANSGQVSATPLSIPALQVAAGGFHSCALLQGGSIKCWGWNNHGQLGNGTSGATAYSATPVLVSGISNAVAVSAGNMHTCALLQGGEVECWGDNEWGELGDGSLIDSNLPVAVPGISATEVSAGFDATCAIQSTGVVMCWGLGTSGQLGDGSFSNSSVPVQVSGITASSASINGQTACARSGGGVSCWGSAGSGQLGNGQTVPQNTATPSSVALFGLPSQTITSGVSSCALLTTGGVSCWGSNESGQLGGGCNNTQCNTPVGANISGVSAIAGGEGAHYCALAGGVAYCWGWNGSGQLGDGTTNDSANPVLVTGLAAATGLAAGQRHTCALVPGGGVACWGDNSWGELGDGSTTQSTTPVPVVGIP